MSEEILIFGHKNPDTDSICSSIVMADLENKLGKHCIATRIGKINKETQFVLDYLKLEAPKMIDKAEDGQEVILVDHNEATQSIDNIAKILKVIDHHTMNFKAPYQLYYRTEPVGCTATVLYKIYKENNIEMTKEIAILCLSSIISDTLLFKSPTCTEDDIKVANALQKIANIDMQEYGLEMLKAGTDLGEFSEEELVNLDAKAFDKGDTKFVIAQVNTVSIEDVLKRQQELESAINSEIDKKGLQLFVFAITDILNSNSKLIVLGKKASVTEKAFEKKLENNTMFLEGVVSRKKQILPNIDKNI